MQVLVILIFYNGYHAPHFQGSKRQRMFNDKCQKPVEGKQKGLGLMVLESINSLRANAKHSPNPIEWDWKQMATIKKIKLERFL